MSVPKQEELDANCEAAKNVYAQMDTEQAQLKLAYEIQGWLASEQDRGCDLADAVAHIEVLLEHILAANGYQTCEAAGLH